MPAPENAPEKKSFWTRPYSLPRWPLALFTLRAFRFYFFALVCLATLIALFYAEEDWRGHRAWQHFAQQSKDRGVSLDWRDYVPPPVPDDQNFAMTPPFAGMFDYEYTPTGAKWRDTNFWQREDRMLFGSYPKEASFGIWIYGRPLDLAAWQNYLRHGNIPSVYSWPVPPQEGQPAEDILFSLKKVAPDLEALRLAATRPESRFPIHYAELPSAIIVHLGYLTSASHVLELRAAAELDSGDTAGAFADTQLVFRLADALATEPLLVSGLVRCRIISDGIQPIWEGLVAHRWPDEQLKAFEDRFAAIDLLAAADRGRRAEAAFTCGWIEFLKVDFSTIGFVDSHTYFGDDQLAGRIIPAGWIDQNAVAAGRFATETVKPDVDATAQRVYPDISVANSRQLEAIPTTPYTFAFKFINLRMPSQAFAHAQTDLNLARVACALERYRLARGHYPPALDAVAPDCIAKLPHDLFTGEPLKYRLNPDGTFMLYSVGWNGADDHGALPSPPPDEFNFRGHHTVQPPATGDWVWKFPSLH